MVNAWTTIRIVTIMHNIIHSQWFNKRSSMALKFVVLHKIASLIIMSQDTRQLYTRHTLQDNVLKGLYFAEILRALPQ